MWFKNNLNSECQNVVLRNVPSTDEVTLYKREFFGIDKECDEKYNLNNNTYDILHNSEEIEYNLNVYAGFIFAVFVLCGLIGVTMTLCAKKDIYETFNPNLLCFLYFVYIGYILSSFIFNTWCFVRIINNDVSGYNCSDTITNEVIRKGFNDSANNCYYIILN